VAIANKRGRGILLVSPSPLLLVSITLYVILMGAVIWSLTAARQWALTHLATADSVGDWQTWREDVKQQQTQGGPVRRRVPQSAEPPALVLMRDYFAVCVTGAILFVTVLYWVTAWFIRGILARPTRENADVTLTNMR
jgi:hypothetical protein